MRAYSRTLTDSLYYAASFTLTEVVVVVGIIAIGISLLFPAIKYTRANSALARCSSNLRQIGLAATAYSQTGHFPYGEGLSSLVALYDDKFITDPSVLGCPATRNDPSGVAQGKLLKGFPNSDPDVATSSYGADLSGKPGDISRLVVTAGDALKPYGTSGKNSINHGENASGQNTLTADGRAAWSNTPDCGVDKDNIYTDSVTLTRFKDTRLKQDLP